MWLKAKTNKNWSFCCCSHFFCGIALLEKPKKQCIFGCWLLKQKTQNLGKHWNNIFWVETHMLLKVLFGFPVSFRLVWSDGPMSLHYEAGEVGCCESRMAERIYWWTERWLELVGVVCFAVVAVVAVVTSPQLLDVVWCSAVVVVDVVVVVVVAQWSCSCGVELV